MDNAISMGRQDEFFGALTETMPDDAIEWRVQKAGKKKSGGLYAMVVPYADSRWLMQRLDEVFGPLGWWDEYEAGPDGGVLCKLTVSIDGHAVTKQDVAENTKVEAVKGGVTDAFKRACVKFNVGNIRALYGCGDLWAEIGDNQPYRAKTPDNVWFNWGPPRDFSLNGTPKAAPPKPQAAKPRAPKGTPITKETRQQIENLFLPIEEMLRPAEKKAITDAMEATEERGQKAIGWLNDRIADLNAAAVE